MDREIMAKPGGLDMGQPPLGLEGQGKPVFGWRETYGI
jgi:hypothetical protein